MAVFHGLRSVSRGARAALTLLTVAAMPAPAVDPFDGIWEFTSDDGTYRERLELEVQGQQVRGTFTALRHGYFSGRTQKDAELRVEGAVRDAGGRLELTLVDPASGSSANAMARRRGDYLILSGGGRETGYAHPGTPLVRSAEHSTEARALSAAITGRVYQTSSAASGRGAYVGGRTRLALCANGEIAYDASDLAATTGPAFGSTADLGSSVARRGTWSVVLYAGAPAVVAHWKGTGTSYSLTRYFGVRPAADGRSAEVDGQPLAAAGTC